MATLLLLLNLAACAVLCAVAMFFYLRHGAPGVCARQHFNQLALIAVSVGAFASGIDALRGGSLDWWAVLLRVGAAMFAGKALWQWRAQRREPT